MSACLLNPLYQLLANAIGLHQNTCRPLSTMQDPTRCLGFDLSFGVDLDASDKNCSLFIGEYWDNCMFES